MSKLFTLDRFQNANNTLCIFGKGKGYREAVEMGVDLAEAYMKNNYGDVLKAYSINSEKVDGYEVLNKAFYTQLFQYVYQDENFKFSPESLSVLRSPNRFNSVQHDRYYDVVKAVETTLVPQVTEKFTGSYNETRNIAWGDTAEFDIESNEILIADRIAEGVPFGGSQHKFNYTVTVNPEPLNISFDTKWYDVAAGKADFGRMFFKAALGFASYFTVQAYNKLYAMAQQVPASYQYTGFTTENIDLATMAVSGANSGATSSIIGCLPALRDVVPENDFFKMAVGDEWIKQGYVGIHANSPLVMLDNLVNPATINTNATASTPSFLFRNDVLFVMPFVGRKPIKTVFEGDMFNITKSAVETADKTERASLTYRVGIEYVYDQIMGLITRA